nr:hypothetical protein [Tanacetum cinerariifolium]
MSSDPNYEWKQLLDIDDSDLLLTPVLRPCNIHVCGDESVLSTHEYMKKIVKKVCEDEDFKSGSWVSATEYVNANGGIVSGCLGDIKNFLKNGKLEQVDSVPGNGSGVAGSGMLMKEEDIVKLMEEEEMVDLELHVCGNVIDQEDLYKIDEEALNLILEKKQGKNGLIRSGWRK